MLVRAPGRSRPAGTGDTAQCVLARATHHAKRHASPALRWHNENRLENSDTTPARGVTTPPDIHERRESTQVSRCILLAAARQLSARMLHGSAQRVVARIIGAWKGANHQVERRHAREQFRARQIPQPAFYFIARHRGLAEAWHNDAHPRATQRGSEVSHLKLGGANSLPLNTDGLEVPFARQSRRPSETQAIRRRRTSTGASR